MSVAEGTTGAIGDPVTATDPDGDTLSYSLVGVDAEAFHIDSATAQLSVGEATTLDFEAQTAYSFEVQASDGALTASRTVEIAITDVDEPPGQVGAPTVSPQSETQLLVSWSAPDNTGPEITGYDIRYRRTGRIEWQVLTLAGAATHVELTDLSIRTRYQVQVRAVNEVGAGDWSPATAALTNEPPWLADWRVLIGFYRTTQGRSWDRDDNWSTSFAEPTAEELDSWYGVTVSKGRVTRLELDRNSLKGPVPAWLSRLTALEVLSLPRNELTGPIPPELGNLSMLRVLELHENSLTGPIPAELANLSNLSMLNFSGNALSGIIPPGLGNLSALVSLNLQRNGLSGPVPVELGALTQLESLRLHQNALTGSIPPQLGRLFVLQSLQIDHNRLMGPVPAELGNLSELQTLNLESNRLSGPLPESLLNLAALSDFQWGDQLPGTGESALCASTDEAFQNWLAGVSKRFGPNCGVVSGAIKDDWRTLVALYAATDGANWRNNLNWSASDSPPTAAELDNWHGVTVSNDRVTHLDLRSNSLSGSIPPELGKLSGLELLVLQDNVRIPRQFGR